jgi:hypothetical protein
VSLSPIAQMIPIYRMLGRLDEPFMKGVEDEIDDLEGVLGWWDPPLAFRCCR